MLLPVAGSWGAGMTNWPFGSFAFNTARAMGEIRESDEIPNVFAKDAAVRSLALSVKPIGRVPPLKHPAPTSKPSFSRVPWYDTKKKTLSFLIGPPSVPPN